MSFNNFGTGIITGIIIGSAVNIAMQSHQPKRSAVNIKRNVGKTLKTIGHVVDSFS